MSGAYLCCFLGGGAGMPCTHKIFGLSLSREMHHALWRNMGVAMMGQRSLGCVDLWRKCVAMCRNKNIVFVMSLSHVTFFSRPTQFLVL